MLLESSALAWLREGEDVRRREGQEMDVFSFCFRSSEPPMSNGGIRYVQCRSSNLNTSKMDKQETCEVS